MPNQIPLDPKLPANFDNSPNEQRSKAQLDAWWDRPFALTRGIGKIEVRCLNGGAWDRSTWLGMAETHEKACEIAEEKQSEWVKSRARPCIQIGETFDVVRMPQRPDQDLTILASFNTQLESASYIEQNFPPPPLHKNFCITSTGVPMRFIKVAAQNSEGTPGSITIHDATVLYMAIHYSPDSDPKVTRVYLAHTKKPVLVTGEAETVAEMFGNLFKVELWHFTGMEWWKRTGYINPANVKTIVPDVDNFVVEFIDGTTIHAVGLPPAMMS